MKIWSCKVGEVDDLPMGADSPMRRAVAQAYRELTSQEPKFLFSGWGAELTALERDVVELEPVAYALGSDESPVTAREQQLIADFNAAMDEQHKRTEAAEKAAYLATEKLACLAAPPEPRITDWCNLACVPSRHYPPCPQAPTREPVAAPPPQEKECSDCGAIFKTKHALHDRVNGYNIPAGKRVCAGCLQQYRTSEPAAAALGAGWQPIATAPKDGTGFLVDWPDAGIERIGDWSEYQECVNAGESPAMWWMPLPMPPSSPGEPR